MSKFCKYLPNILTDRSLLQLCFLFWQNLASYEEQAKFRMEQGMIVAIDSLLSFLFKFIWHKESGQYNLLVMIIRAGVVISEWDSVSPAKVINQPHTFNFELS